MKRLEWRDEARRGEPPYASEIEFGRLKVSVHQHIDSPGSWFVSSHRVGVDKVELRAKKMATAKREGVKFVRDYLRDRQAEAAHILVEGVFEDSSGVAAKNEPEGAR